MMNLFRALADGLHLLSFVILLVKIQRARSASGLSLKMQELYAVVFICRYLDLFWSFHSLYLTVMKILYISATLYTVYLIRVRYKGSYDHSLDNFQVLFLLVPCAVLSLVFTEAYEFSEILWTFSIFLEAVALLPQVLVLQRSAKIENITADYVFCVGAYRALYLFNWAYRYVTEDGYIHGLVVVCGLLQTALYSDFAYVYVKARLNNTPLELPT